jgi:hypothetical protein
MFHTLAFDDIPRTAAWRSGQSVDLIDVPGTPMLDHTVVLEE